MPNESYTDIFLFSHGWNNDWTFATHLYDGWITGFAKFRQDRNLAYGRDFRPLFVGIIWPSTALVLPSEQGPKWRDARPEEPIAQEREEIRMLAESLPATKRERRS